MQTITEEPKTGASWEDVEKAALTSPMLRVAVDAVAQNWLSKEEALIVVGLQLAQHVEELSTACVAKLATLTTPAALIAPDSNAGMVLTIAACIEQLERDPSPERVRSVIAQLRRSVQGGA